MQVFGFPSDLDQASILLWPFFTAWAIALPILFIGNFRYTGLIPQSNEAWYQATSRISAILAFLGIIFGLGNGPSGVGGIGVSSASQSPIQEFLALLSFH